MDELSVGPAEELELLIKRLGPVSSKYARSIEVSNVNKPSVESNSFVGQTKS